MDKFIKYRWWLAMHIIFMVFAMLVHPILGEAYDKWYFKGVALAWCIPPIFLLWCFRKTKAIDILIIFSFFALNNFADELFFNVEKLQWNEVFFALSTIITVYFSCRAKRKKSGNN